MGNPVIGNSLFALFLALLHAPPMLGLLWTQRWLRRRRASNAMSLSVQTLGGGRQSAYGSQPTAARAIGR